MLPHAFLMTASLLLQDPAAGDGATSIPSVPYPIQESVEPTEGDAAALLRKVVDGMGREGLAELERIGFATEFWNWRGPKLAYYEKFRAKATLGPKAIGFVNDATISPESGGSQGIRFVVNDDDRFFVQRTTVSSSAQAELSATQIYYNQLFLVLGPWLIERAGTEVSYEGIATITAFAPKSYAPPDEAGGGGYSDYKPTEIRCHKIRAAMPESFRGANGAEAELWISMEDQPRLLAFQSAVESRAYAYGPFRPIYHVVSWQEVGGTLVPEFLDMTSPTDAERSERIRISEIVPDVKILPEELRRP